jgi:hypothetical protein
LSNLKWDLNSVSESALTGSILRLITGGFLALMPRCLTDALTLRPPTFHPLWHLDPLETSTVTLFPCDTLTPEHLVSKWLDCTSTLKLNILPQISGPTVTVWHLYTIQLRPTLFCDILTQIFFDLNGQFVSFLFFCSQPYCLHNYVFFLCDIPSLCDICHCDSCHIYSEILNESRTSHLSREPYGTSLGIGGLGGVSTQWSDPWDDTVHVDI